MEEKLGQSTAVLFKYEKLILAEEETTSAGGCGVSLAAFSRRGAFFYRWKGVKEYESEIYLPRLWDTLGL